MEQKSAEYIRDCYKQVFGTPEGKVVLKDMMAAHYWLGSLPAEALQFGEGQRNVVLRIFSICGIDPTRCIDV